jgi:hypothetical protein
MYIATLFLYFFIFLRVFYLYNSKRWRKYFFESIERSRDIRQLPNNSIVSLVIIFGLFIQHFPGVIFAVCVCMGRASLSSATHTGC